MEQLKYILDKRKREDKKYLFELQKLMDTVSNVKDEELKERIDAKLEVTSTSKGSKVEFNIL